MSHSDDLTITSVTANDIPRAPGRGLGARVVAQMVSRLRHGHLKVVLPSGQVVEARGEDSQLEATIVIRRWRALPRILIGGDIGFAEGYISGDWTTPDLTQLVRLAARNTAALGPAIEGNPVTRFVQRMKHVLNANTRQGSRRNIQAHYDLGNDFYRLWLDPSMLYSSAIWHEETQTLEAAQAMKLEAICRALELEGAETVLEIGCGWGALAAHLANEKKATVTGITLSPAQLEWARATASAGAATQSIDLRLQDYRDVDGTFDRIVSIEMFEAVGEAYWRQYFETLKRCLKRDGKAVLQVISIDDDRFQRYRRNAEFIQKYIFPGGFLPSETALTKAAAEAGLAVRSVQRFGKSYARTLAEWRNRFYANWPEIEKLGFDARFRRIWEYYLCYCEAGFEERTIDVGLYTLAHAEGAR